ncbi:MAG TPA: GTPase Era [Bacteroidia bacterium]|nr:GTPase Era [Bacteroidia bacterium]
MHKAGYVNIVGNPNAGKSTLMNILVGERLSIITSKAQTTRHRILGIVNSEDFQIIYSDTPGIIVPKYKMQEGMMQFLGTALTDADILLLVIDLTDDCPIEPKSYSRIRNAKVPVLILLNKMDAVSGETLERSAEKWTREFPEAKMIPLSALKKKNTDIVIKQIVEALPEHPPYFPKDELTDKPERFFVSEIIREKILHLYDQEIPYSVEVVVEEFQEKPNIVKIRAIIYVMRESQKGIILGERGSAIKKLGTSSRIDIEKFLQQRVFLELFVKVDPDWRDSERQLKRYGYLK